MPYVNIPRSKVSKSIGKLVGKMQGELANKAVSSVDAMKNQILQKGPGVIEDLALKGLQNKLTGVKNSVNRVNRRINKIKKLPKKLEAPIKGLEAAIKVILSLPIPQSVPPGIGLPMLVTTKYADFLHMLKELVAQAKEDIEAILAILEIPETFLASLERVLSRFDNGVKALEIEKALVEGAPKDELLRLGIIDSEGNQLLSSIAPFMIGEFSIGPNGEMKERPLKGRDSDLFTSSGNVQQDIDSSIKKLDETVQKLEDSNIDESIKDDLRKLLNNIQPESELKDKGQGDARFFHTGPNGDVYELKIQADPNSPSIAQRRFAIAVDNEGVTVLRGAKSFSPDVNILLDEIKFRIDNQLP